LGTTALNRMLRSGLLIAAGGITAATIIAFNLGDLASKSRNPLLYAAAAPLSPRSSALAAEEHLALGDYQQAERLSIGALEASPLSAIAVRTLGLSLQAQGRSKQAARVMSIGAGLGWRDIPTQSWLVEAYSSQGEIAAALERADALARQQTLREETMRFFLAAAATPELRLPLIERLAIHPPWSQDFFEELRAIPAEKSAAYIPFLASLTASGHALSSVEVEPFASGLFAKGHYRIASDAWQRFVSRGAPITDGGFSSSPLASEHRRGPFQWSFPQAAGVDVAIGAPPAEASGRALYAGSNGNVRAEIARQAMVLAPGKYVISMDALSEDAARPDGFSLTLACLPSSRVLLATERTISPSPWTSFTYEVSIPSTDCEAQMLALTLRSYQPRPLALWFDNIGIRAAR
jgi:hypothetical protein